MASHPTNCLSCACELAQKSRGRPRIRCEPCGKEELQRYWQARYVPHPRPPKPPKPPKAEKRPPKPRYVPIGPQALTGICTTCSTEFAYVQEGRGRRRRFCSPECKAIELRRAKTTVPCRQCGTEFRPRHVAKALQGTRSVYCSQPCYTEAQRIYPTKAAQATAEAKRRRARLRGAKVEHFACEEIYERDNWRCGLCHKPVDRRLKAPHKMGPSLDHIIPLAEGGEHSRRNVQLAHWLCNSRKGERAGGQLRLFG